MQLLPSFLTETAFLFVATHYPLCKNSVYLLKEKAIFYRIQNNHDGGLFHRRSRFQEGRPSRNVL